VRTRTLLGALAATLVATAPGCGADPPPAEAVAWIDDVCGSLVDYTRVAAAPPAIDPNDPVAAVEGLRT
jgi:hypothetical protein